MSITILSDKNEVNYSEIDHIKFTLWSGEEIKKYSVVEVKESKLTGEFGVNDDKMGVIQNNSKCVTCGLDNTMCVGHFGHINLEVPIPHFKLYEDIIKSLMCYCYKCEELIIDPQEAAILGLTKYRGIRRFNAIVNYIDVHNKICGKCFTHQPKYKYIEGKFYKQFDKSNKPPEITSTEIYNIFKSIKDEDLEYLGINPEIHPINMIMTSCPILPKPDRPFVESGSVISDDDLTTKYGEIIKFNNKLQTPNLKETDRNEIISKLEFHIQTLIDNTKKKSRPVNGRPYKCISQRVNGKNGIFRKNLLGKRCDFTIRCPIGPDPNIRANEVIIPTYCAEKLTFPEIVCDFNKRKLQKLITESKANVVIRNEVDAKGIMRENRYHLKTKLNKYTYQTDGESIKSGDIIIRNNQKIDYDKLKPKDKEKFTLMPSDRIYRGGKFIKSFKLSEIIMTELDSGDIILRKRRVKNSNYHKLYNNDRVINDTVYRCETVYLFVQKRKHLDEWSRCDKVKYLPSKFYPYKIIDENGFKIDRQVKDTDLVIFSSYKLTDENREEYITEEYTINIEQLRLEGREYKYEPGDRLIRKGKELLNFNVVYSDPFQIKNGDKVERQLVTGDIILVGRQPSLHIGSMLARKVRIIHENNNVNNNKPVKTIRFNLSQCRSLNADFDGDEMNCYIPQSYATQSELHNLCSTEALIKSTQSGSLLQVICQDSLIGGYFFTYREFIFERFEFFDACMAIETKIDPYERWVQVKDTLNKLNISRNECSSFNLFSLLLPPDFEYNHNGMKITRGVILSGVLNKTVLGSGFLSIPHKLEKLYGANVCVEFLSNFQILISQILVITGFSVGISDCSIDKKSKERIKNQLLKMYIENNSYISSEKNEMSLEQKISNCLSNTVKEGEKIVKESLDKDNPLVIMINSGAKGSIGNISQICSIVGQQYVDGKRMQLTYGGRTIPFYPHEDLTNVDLYESRGFVKNGYLDGLNPQQFFFHAAGGREGVIDTAIKTAKSGYIQRKLTKKMEDLVVSYNGFVLNANEEVIQPIYANGLDPSRMDLVNGKQFFVDPLNIINKINTEVELR